MPFIVRGSFNWRYVLIILVLVAAMGLLFYLFYTPEPTPLPISFSVTCPDGSRHTPVFLKRGIEEWCQKHGCVEEGGGDVEGGGEISRCLEQAFSKKEISKGVKDERGETVFLISLTSREFLPVKNTEDALKCFDSLSSGESYYGLIQFEKTLSTPEKEILKEAGIGLERYGYIHNKTWLAEVSESLSEKESVKELVRWVGVLRPEDKVLEEVWNGDFGGISVTEEGTRLEIIFFRGVKKEKAREIIESYGGSIIGEASTYNKFDVKIKEEPDKAIKIVRKLAEENEVMNIDEAPPPPTTTN